MTRLILTIILAVGAFVALFVAMVGFFQPAIVWLLDDGSFTDRVAFFVGFGSVSVAIGMSLSDTVLALIFDHHNKLE